MDALSGGVGKSALMVMFKMSKLFGFIAV